MKRDISVSVIVSVYNTEKYVGKCLESLVKQTLKKIEIIVVNNGCRDRSQEIIDKFAERYPAKIVKMYIPKNKGLGYARNEGIKAAKGKYIGFVDSDDWADPKMFETMYKEARQGHDIVICDYIEIQDGQEYGHATTGFRGKRFNKHEAVKYAADTAFSWNKLYKKELYEKLNFLHSWYEDVGTTPILISYANSLSYVQKPLIYYRQRVGSTIYSQNIKTLGIIDSWKRILKKVNPSYKDEAVYSIARSINIFIDFKPEYTIEFLNFAHEHKRLFEKNHYFQEAIQTKQIRNILKIPIIPKKVHYCWFGKNKKNEFIQKCIQSWREKLPDYKLIEWNEKNCNIKENKFIEQAYKAKKWAFVSDYFRLKALLDHGGIYLDTDVEITGNLNKYLINNSFFAFETSDLIQTGVIGSVKGARVIEKMLKTYKNESFIKPNGEYNTEPNIVRVTKLLVNKYGLELTGKRQVLSDDISIYPANELTLDAGDGENRAIHYFALSWKPGYKGPLWSLVVLENYMASRKNNSD